jgi:endonuclease/exonuclease/phosphatase (EEP) superfamily protein YafD
MIPLLILWAIRLFLLLLVVATALPFWRAGFWVVRLCDFPRLQIAALLGIALLAVVVYAFATRWNTELQIYCGLALLLGFWQVGHILPFTPVWRPEVAPVAADPGAAIRIAVVNLKVDNTQRAEAQETLAALDADVLLLIEVDEEWNQVLGAFDSDYPHSMGVVRGDGLGIKLWSRFPLEDQEVRHLVSDDRASLFTTIVLEGGGRVQFVGVHPTPPGLKSDEDESRHDSRIRDAELIMIAREIEEQPDEAWIVTGDFNDVAWSHTTQLFKRISGLVDPRIGRGLYNTYHAEHVLLRYPIDHVFVSPEFRLGDLSRVAIPGSDHFAVVTALTPGVTSPTRDEPRPSEAEEEEAEEIVEEGAEDAAERGDATEEVEQQAQEK